VHPSNRLEAGEEVIEEPAGNVAGWSNPNMVGDRDTCEFARRNLGGEASV